jgi:hypothetical protein
VLDRESKEHGLTEIVRDVTAIDARADGRVNTDDGGDAQAFFVQFVWPLWCMVDPWDRTRSGSSDWKALRRATQDRTTESRRGRFCDRLASQVLTHFSFEVEGV